MRVGGWEQRQLQRLIDGVDELDVELIDHVRGDVDQVLLVLSRHQNRLDSGSRRSEDLALDAADREDEARAVLEQALAGAARFPRDRVLETSLRDQLDEL